MFSLFVRHTMNFPCEITAAYEAHSSCLITSFYQTTTLSELPPIYTLVLKSGSLKQFANSMGITIDFFSAFCCRDSLELERRSQPISHKRRK